MNTVSNDILIDGLSVHYTVDGEGEKTVLLLHGWGCDGEVYKAIREHLSGRYRVLTPDFSGFGKSEEPKEAWDVDRYAEFIIKLCGKINISPEIMLVHSFGARVAFKLLSQNACPFKIQKLIITGGAGIRPKKSLKSKLSLLCYKAGKGIMSAPPLKMLFPNAVDNMRKKRGSADYNACSGVMRGTFIKVVNEDLRGLLPKISPETLLIWGENDEAVPLSDARIMEKEMPNAGLAVMKGAGHYCFLQQPTLFLRILDNFI